MKDKARKLLKDNVGKYLYDLEISKCFLTRGLRKLHQFYNLLYNESLKMMVVPDGKRNSVYINSLSIGGNTHFIYFLI